MIKFINFLFLFLLLNACVKPSVSSTPTTTSGASPSIQIPPPPKAPEKTTKDSEKIAADDKKIEPKAANLVEESKNKKNTDSDKLIKDGENIAADNEKDVTKEADKEPDNKKIEPEAANLVQEFKNKNKGLEIEIYKLKHNLTSINTDDEELIKKLDSYELMKNDKESTLEKLEGLFSEIKLSYDKNLAKYPMLKAIHEKEKNYNFLKEMPDTLNNVAHEKYKQPLQEAYDDYLSKKTDFIDNKIDLENYTKSFNNLLEKRIYCVQKDQAEDILNTEENKYNLINAGILDTDYFKAESRKEQKDALEAYKKLYEDLKNTNFNIVNNGLQGLIEALKALNEQISSHTDKYQKFLTTRLLYYDDFSKYLNDVNKFANDTFVEAFKEGLNSDNAEKALIDLNKLSDSELKKELLDIDLIKEASKDNEKYNDFLEKAKSNTLNTLNKNDFQSLSKNKKYQAVQYILTKHDTAKSIDENRKYQQEFLDKIIDFTEESEDIFLTKDQYRSDVFEIGLFKKIEELLFDNNNLQEKMKNYFTKRLAFFIVDQQVKIILKNNYATTSFNNKNNELSAKAWIKLKQMVPDSKINIFYFTPKMNDYFSMKEEDFNNQKLNIIKKDPLDEEVAYKAILMRDADKKIINKVLSSYNNLVNKKEDKKIIYQNLIACALLNGNEVIITDEIGLGILIELMQDKLEIVQYFLKYHANSQEKSKLKEWFNEGDNQTKYKKLYDQIKEYFVQ